MMTTKKRGNPTLALVALLLSFMALTPASAEPDAAEIEFWRSVKETAIPAELEAYLKAYPEGQFAPLARIRLKALTGGAGEDSSEQTSDTSEEKTGPEAEADESETAAERPSPPQTEADDKKPDVASSAESPSKPKELKIAVPLGVHPADSTKGALGVRIIDSTPGLSEAFDLDTSGALVTGVGDPSAKYGVKAGHLIVSVDNDRTPDGQTLVKLIGEHKPGDEVSVGIIELAPTHEELLELLRSKAETSPGAGHALAWLITNDAEAAELLRKAAEADYVPAMFDLGSRYRNGQGVAKDDAKGAEWYRKAAEKGHASAAHQLGLMYHEGVGVKKDGGQAVAWFRKAADQGVPPAIFNLGLAYAEGNGVPKDRLQALEWFRKAADAGSTAAMSNLGYMYERGEGVERDYGQAAEWYRKAGDRGHMTAKNNLALLYDKGRGVPQDSNQAAQLMLEAYRGGDQYAKQNLESKSSALSLDTRKEVQRLLQQEGVYDGTIDGRFGSGTKQALNAFAAKQTTPATSPKQAAEVPPPTPSAASQSAGEGFGDISDLDTLD